MEHPTPNQQPEHQPGEAEREPVPETRIYVASLSDYNDGRLHGVWLDATAEPDELGPLRLGEYEDLATISQIGQGIATHGPAFAHWASVCGTDDRDELGRFDDVYLGHWDSIEDYAEELLDDLGIDDLIERNIPDSLQGYVTVDTEGFARDLEYSGDVTSSEGDNGVYLFDQNR